MTESPDERALAHIAAELLAERYRLVKLPKVKLPEHPGVILLRRRVLAEALVGAMHGRRRL